MSIDTEKLRRLNKLPMALGILECPKEGGPIRFVQMRTVVDCGIEVWGQKQIDEHTENLWATIDSQATEIARLREALIKMVNSYAFIKPPGYPKSDAEKQAETALTQQEQK